MESLSSRGRRNVDAIMPHMPAAILEAQEDSGMLDLAMAENWVLRDTMTDLCREAISTRLEGKHLCMPLGFYGAPKLLDAIAEFANQQMKPHVPVKANEIVTTPGANGSIMGLLWNICEAGDGVIVPAPFWCVQIVEAKPDTLQDAGGMSMLKSLEITYDEAMNRGVPIKALIISNPNNPLAVSWSREILEGMLQFCQKKNIHFISDEVFTGVTFDNAGGREPTTSLLSIDAEKLGCDPWRIHAIWSPSKTFGMSGVRLGCVITRAGSDFRNALALSAPQEVSALASLALLHILTLPTLPDLLGASAKALSDRHSTLTTALDEMGIPCLPCNSTLSLLAKIAPKATAWEDEAEVIGALKKAGILVGGGRAYHVPEPGWARITFAVEKGVLDEAIGRMRNILTQTA